MGVYLKLSVLFYAILLLSKNNLDMQDAFNATVDYCKKYNLRIDTSKTKILVFSKGKVKKLEHSI